MFGAVVAPISLSFSLLLSSHLFPCHVCLTFPGIDVTCPPGSEFFPGNSHPLKKVVLLLSLFVWVTLWACSISSLGPSPLESHFSQGAFDSDEDEGLFEDLDIVEVDEEDVLETGYF